VGLFNSDSGRLAKLFPGGDLDALVWAENLDNLANGADYVDVVVSSSKPAILADVRKVGLTYWPDGPVARGVQNYTTGTSVTFARVLVRTGGTLALASSSPLGMGDLAARVDVVPVGRGASIENDRRGQSGRSPLEQLSEATGTVLGVAALGLLTTRAGQAARLVATAGSAVLLLAGYRVGHSGGALVYQYGAGAAYADSAGARDGGSPIAAGMRSTASGAASAGEDDEDDADERDDAGTAQTSPATIPPRAARP
jgi:hypothetical protein